LAPFIVRRRADLRSEAEVGERALAVEVVDDPRHLAAADVKRLALCDCSPYG
jgi:hypothetical protein